MDLAPPLLVDPLDDLVDGLPWWALLLESALQVAAVVFILLRRQRPSSVNLTWIMLVLALPVVGLLLYLLVGEVRLGGRRKRRHAEIVSGIREQGWPHAELGLYPDLPEDHADVAALAESVGGMATRTGNAVELLPDSEQMVDRLVADIDAARDHCHLLFYIYAADELARRVTEALVRAAGRGVACRLLVDGVGSRPFLQSSDCTRLRTAAVQVVEALPTSLLRVPFARIDLRNHRKIAVIDGQVGYTGSQNMVDPAFAPKAGFGPWVDATLRLRGPAVQNLQELFVEDWFLDAHESIARYLSVEPPFVAEGVPLQVIPTGPDDEHAALRVVSQSMFHIAREEILVTTPYFVPTEAEVMALGTAARRGVRVRLVVPARNDSPLVAMASRGLYADLLEHGVEIHEFTSGLLHSKTCTIDRRIGCIGTANFDRRSFELNFEVTCLVYDSDFTSRLRVLQLEYARQSTPVDPDAWARRPLGRRLLESAAGIMSPVL